MKPEKIEHLAQLADWPEQNVIRYQTPAKVTLSDFQLDWQNVCGSFVLAFDEVIVPDRVALSLGDNGRFNFSIPTLASPHGVPDSKANVEFTDDTQHAIHAGLGLVTPQFASCGVHPLTHQLIQPLTPLHERVLDPEGLEISKRLLSGSFSVSVCTQRRSHAPVF
jgi:hypothetical protein